MIEKSKRAPGRPRAFDTDEALQKAMRVFWAQGYDGTNMDDLEAAMGIGRPSLYRAFGDKRSLFMRCLGHYSEHVAGRCVSQLHSSPDVREAVRAFFRQSVENVGSEEMGCMVGCVASSVDDPEIREFMRASSRQVQEAVEDRLAQAVVEGQLPECFPLQARARRAFDFMIALGFRGRSGAGREALLQDADDAAAMLFADCRYLPADSES